MTAPSQPDSGYPATDIALSCPGYAPDPIPADVAAAIVTTLRRWRFRLDNEAELQRQVFETLVAAGFAAEREVRLGPADRIDVLVGAADGPAVGIEIKIKGQRRAIYRQCVRYYAYDRVAALVLVTNAARGFPAELHGKPIFVLELGKSWL